MFSAEHSRDSTIPRSRCTDTQTGARDGIVILRITKCEMLQYRVFQKIMTALCCSHSRLWSIKLTLPPEGTVFTQSSYLRNSADTFMTYTREERKPGCVAEAP